MTGNPLGTPFTGPVPLPLVCWNFTPGIPRMGSLQSP